MKKALLAVLIPSLLGASSAFAGGVDLIKNDDMTLNFNGDIDLKSYVKFKDGESDSTQTEVIFDDIDFDFTYNVSDELTFISGVDLTADPGSETEDKAAVGVDLIWVGVKTEYGQVQWGNLETSFDPLGIDNAEIYTGVASGDTDGGGTDHFNAIKYDYVTGDLWLSATYGIPGEKKANKKITQLAWKYTPGDLQINGGFGQTTAYDSSEAEEAKATYAQAEIEYAFDAFTVAVLVSIEDADYEQDDVSVVTNGLEVDFGYQATNKLKFNIGADYVTQDIDGYDDLTTMYVAAKYKFASNVSLQMEVARKDGDILAFNSRESDTTKATYGDLKGSSTTNETKAGILLNLQF